MKKGCFLVYDAGNAYKDCPTSGIMNKIHAQVNSMNIDDTLTCELRMIPQNINNKMSLLFTYLFKNQFVEFEQEIESYDYLYIRRFIPVTKGLIHLLKEYKIKNPQGFILYEIPTYPYDHEHKSITMKVLLIIDKFFRIKLKNNVDKLVIVGNKDSAFGIPGIKMINGIDCSKIPTIKQKNQSNVLELIAVANFEFYSGYDRLIEGLHQYYTRNFEKMIKIYLVGPENKIILKYKNMVRKYKLENYIVFTGAIYGEQLTNLYNSCDLAVCSLGLHRKYQFESYELKSREYITRGLPIIASGHIDVLPDNIEYVHYIESNESPVNINKLISFYENLSSKYTRMELANMIRKFAFESCDISITMKKIIDIIQSNLS